MGSPQWLKTYWQNNPVFICDRHDEGNCKGRLTKEHALIFAGKQVQEIFAVLTLCAFHHGVDEFQDRGDMNKRKHEWIALSRATEEDFNNPKYYRNNWKRELKLLENQFGIYGKNQM